MSQFQTSEGKSRKGFVCESGTWLCKVDLGALQDSALSQPEPKMKINYAHMK